MNFIWQAWISKINLLWKWNTISKFLVFYTKIYFALQVYFVLNSCALSTHSLDIHSPYLLYIYIYRHRHRVYMNISFCIFVYPLMFPHTHLSNCLSPCPPVCQSVLIIITFCLYSSVFLFSLCDYLWDYLLVEKIINSDLVVVVAIY